MNEIENMSLFSQKCHIRSHIVAKDAEECATLKPKVLPRQYHRVQPQWDLNDFIDGRNGARILRVDG